MKYNFVHRKNVLLEHVLVWVKRKKKQIVKKYDDAANNKNWRLFSKIIIVFKTTVGRMKSIGTQKKQIS